MQPENDSVSLEQPDYISEMACGSYGIIENFETIYSACVVVCCYLLPLTVITVNYSRIGIFLVKVSVLLLPLLLLRLLMSSSQLFSLLFEAVLT